MDRVKFGRKLFAARKERNLTAERLASRTGISASFIRQIECGKRSPSMEFLITLCNELEVSPDYLLAGNLDKGRSDKLQEIEAKIRSFSPRELRILENFVDALEDGPTKN